MVGNMAIRLRTRIANSLKKDIELSYAASLQALQKDDDVPLITPRTAIFRPSSEATDILESEDENLFSSESSPPRSVVSVSILR